MKLSRVENTAEDRRKAKAWLVDLRKAQGWGRGDVAELLGTNTDTVKNWELPSRGFANGFTLMRYLRLLGVLADEAPVDIPALGRLAALEAEVAESVKLGREALEILREAQRQVRGEQLAQGSGG